MEGVGVGGPVVFDAVAHNWPGKAGPEKLGDAACGCPVAASPLADGFGEREVVSELSIEKPELRDVVARACEVGVQGGPKPTILSTRLGWRAARPRAMAAEGMGTNEHRPVCAELNQAGGDSISVRADAVAVGWARGAPEA